MTAHVHIGATALALEVSGARRAIQPCAWLTRGGMVLCLEEDEGLDDFLGPELRGSLSLHAGAPWQPRDDAVQVTEAGLLPRAVRWAAALRALAQAAQADIQAAALHLSGVEGNDGMADACRALALLGWRLAGDAPAGAEFVGPWLDGRAWAELACENGGGGGGGGGAGGVLVAVQARLPAKKRFGRQSGARPAIPRLLLDGEPLDFGNHRLDALGESHEFEVAWERDGAIHLDLLVDESWRPLPLLRAAPYRGVRNRLAADTYAALAYWEAVLGQVQADIIEPLVTIAGEAR